MQTEVPKQNTVKTGRPLVVRWPSLWSAMQSAGMKDEDLASIVGVAPGTVKDWRNGYRTPPTATLARVAIALNKDPGSLLKDAPLVVQR